MQRSLNIFLPLIPQYVTLIDSPDSLGETRESSVFFLVIWVMFLRMACLLELLKSANSHESSGNSQWKFPL